jgi:hypothetical protein
MNVWIWLAILVFYCIHAWINKANNDFGGKWFWFAWLISIIPVFPLLARISKNILWDGMMYDIIIFLSYVGTLLYLGAGKTFTTVQWVGCVFTVLGFILMKARI